MSDHADGTPVAHPQRPTPERIAPADLHQRLLDEYAPPSLVATEAHQVVHLSDRVGRYLQLTGGEPSADLLRLARPELRSDLRLALQEAVRQRACVQRPNVPIPLDGVERAVTITVKPVLREDVPLRGYFLILFDESDPDAQEELGSSAGVVTTFNQGLKGTSDELGVTNTDLLNLINSSDVGTIFLDRNLCVRLSTPTARAVFNLLDADAGRPLSDITSRLLYTGLLDDARSSLNDLRRIDHEVETRDGRWHAMHVRPYRTADDRIDGVVITFQDITERRSAERQVRQSEERLRLLIDSVLDYAIFTMASDGKIDSWNPGAERMFGYRADEILGTPLDLLFTPEDRAGGIPAQELERAARDGRAPDERYQLRKSGERFYCSGVTTRLDPAGGLGFAKIARDLTAQRKAAEALKEAHASLEHGVEQRTRALQMEILERSAAQDRATDLVRKLVTSQEDERARIARDLHDQIGQQLTALRLTLERTAEERPSDQQLVRAIELARTIDSELGFIAWELRPAVLDDLGLAAALPRFVEDWSEHYGIGTEYRAAGFEAGHLPREAEVAFYRIAQEALNNVSKHAQASRVDVMLESRDRSVVLVIEDNGVGFDVSTTRAGDRGIGLIGMFERAALAGAALQIESVSGGGTSVFLRRPADQQVATEGKR